MSSTPPTTSDLELLSAWDIGPVLATATPTHGTIIDWGQSYLAPRAWEIARTLDLVCTFEVESSRAFLIGYRAHAPYEIDCWSMAQLFRKGHRIGLQITSSAFPKYERNLNTGESLATGTRMIIAEQQIYHDTTHPSCIILPIIPTR
jgi:hypothetical protein